MPVHFVFCGRHIAWMVLFCGALISCNKDIPATTGLPQGNAEKPGMPPINDLGTGEWRGRVGGLYSNGSNEMPAGHLNEGLDLARLVVPVNQAGIADAAGKAVWLSVGMSNTTQETQAFLQLANLLPGKNAALALVDGAQSNFDLDMINEPGTPYWNTIMDRLQQRGLDARQVQVIWFKQADRRFPDTSMAGYINNFKVKLRTSLVIMKQRFPNLKMVYLSGRIYAGYQTGTGSNPEPFAYYTSWAIKSLIEDQINGVPVLRYKGPDAPITWIAWGPYLWANGANPRKDGLRWIFPEDFQPDGIHPSAIGARKVGQMLIDFFTGHPTTRPWFMQ